ncbi:MAG: rhodanese-like domain-containing protein [Flavobacteriales bacterium]
MLRTLFGMGPKVDLGELARNGATILDVRTKGEYAEGHVKGSLNIPLDRLAEEIKRVPKGKKVITCCRSGARSGMAVRILEQHGLEAYNGGAWTTVRALLGK